MAKDIKEALQIISENSSLQSQLCTHAASVQAVTPTTNEGCEDCLKMGDTWVHLRVCLSCGHVGCCDNSKNKHATRHFKESGHPVIMSFEPGEYWLWCYQDEQIMMP